MKHGCSMWGNSGSNPICWTHDTLTPLFRCKRYRAPLEVFCVLLSTFLYDLSDYWRKRKSLIIKTSCLGHTKHLCPRVYNLMIGACVKCKTLTRFKFCGSHVHVQCLLHLWTIFNTATIFNSQWSPVALNFCICTGYYPVCQKGVPSTFSSPGSVRNCWEKTLASGLFGEWRSFAQPKNSLHSVQARDGKLTCNSFLWMLCLRYLRPI